MTTRTLTDTDKREIRDVEDLIATLTSYADSIARVGFDKHYALNDKHQAFREMAALTGCDELGDMADAIWDEIGPQTLADREADRGDYLYEQQREANWSWTDPQRTARGGIFL